METRGDHPIVARRHFAAPYQIWISSPGGTARVQHSATPGRWTHSQVTAGNSTPTRTSPILAQHRPILPTPPDHHMQPQRLGLLQRAQPGTTSCLRRPTPKPSTCPDISRPNRGRWCAACTSQLHPTTRLKVGYRCGIMSPATMDRSETPYASAAAPRITLHATYAHTATSCW